MQLYNLMEEEKFLVFLRVEYFRKQNKKKTEKYFISDCKHIKVLTPKQMRQRLPIAVQQVNAGNTSENLRSKFK